MKATLQIKVKYQNKSDYKKVLHNNNNNEFIYFHNAKCITGYTENKFINTYT